jgi:hypothetical protein
MRYVVSKLAAALVVAGTMVLGQGITLDHPAAAQGLLSDMDFRGMDTLRVTASPMTVESLDCGIESSGLVRELRRQLDSEGMKSSDADSALGVITVLSARNGDTGVCNSTLMLGAYKKASFFDKDVGWIRSGYVVVWQSAVLVVSSAETHPVQVRDALSRLGAALLVDWRGANRPTAATAGP